MNNAPTSAQLNRACRLYSAGADALTFCAELADELTPEGIWLAWHAAKAAHAIDQRYPFTGRLVTRNGTEIRFK